MIRGFAGLLLVWCLLAEAGPIVMVSTRPAPASTPIQRRIGIAFPVVTTLGDIGTSRGQLVDLGSRTVRMTENWKTREASEGVYSWAGLDSKIDTFHNAGIKIMLTIEADGPAWRCGTSNARSCVFTDIPAFEDYITTLCRRYLGKIHTIQFGNEAFSSYWYVGTSSDFLTAWNAFYAVVRAEMPAARIALAGAQVSLPHAFAVCVEGRAIPTYSSSTGALLNSAQVAAWCADAEIFAMRANYIAVTAGAQYDVLDVHLYDNMEYWDQYMAAMRNLLPGRTWIASELGAPNKRYESTDDAFHAGRVSTLLSTARNLGFVQVYYFQLLEYDPAVDAEHERSGLLRFSDRTTKPGYDTVKAFNSRISE